MQTFIQFLDIQRYNLKGSCKKDQRRYRNQFYENQCRDKFKNVIRNYKISKFLLKFILDDIYLIIYETLYQY